jgi:hypothetical protein
MTDLLEGKLGFLLSNVGSGSADVKFLGVIRSLAPAFPQLEVRRVIADASGTGQLEPLDAKRGRITLTQLNEGGSSSQSANGLLERVLDGTPPQVGTSFVWEFTLTVQAAFTPVKGKRLELVLLGRLQPSDPFTELTRVPVSGIAASQLNTPTPGVLALLAKPVPRLSVGINQVAVPPLPDTYSVRSQPLAKGNGSAENAGSGTSADLAAALYEVFVRLDAPDSLNAVWDAQSQDNTLFNLSSSVVKRDPVRTADELWARQVTEMLMCAPYGGPSGTYGISPESRFISEGLNGSDPRYGVTYACQQLASFGLASRGVKFTKLQKGGELLLNAGSAAAKTFTSTPIGGSWFTFGGEIPVQVSKPDGTSLQLQGNIPTTGKAFFDAGIGPGSVFLFANRVPRNDDTGFNSGSGCTVVPMTDGSAEVCVKTDKSGKATTTFSKIKNGVLVDNTADAHLAFVLRVDARRKVFQTFDTGGLGVPNRGVGVTVFPSGSGFHSGNFDDPEGTVIKGGDPFRGMGVLPPLTPDAAPQLVAQVETLKTAMPLGFARFVLIRRGSQPSNQEFKPGNVHKLITDNRLVYASSLLRMHGDEATQNYHISRYLWSLRDFPARADLEAWWFLYIPIAELARATLAAARTDTVDAIARSAFSIMSSTRKKTFQSSDSVAGQQTPDVDAIVRNLLTPLLDCVVRADGQSTIIGSLRSPNNLHALHVLEAQPNANSRPNLPRRIPFPAGFNEAPLPSYFRG